MDLISLIENATLFGVFLTVALIGLGIFLMAFIFDGILDGLFHVSFGETSIPIVQFVGVFLATTGGSGLISLSLGLNNVVATTVISVVIGVTLAGLFAFAMGKLQRLANKEFELDKEAVTGQEVLISWWKATEGEVIVSFGGNIFKAHAVSEEPLENTHGKFLVTGAEFSHDRLVKVTVTAIAN